LFPTVTTALPTLQLFFILTAQQYITHGRSWYEVNRNETPSTRNYRGR